MNEQAIQQVITDYALENANLRVAVATLQAEIKVLKEKESDAV
jgi:hypothetical protein